MVSRRRSSTRTRGELVGGAVAEQEGRGAGPCLVAPSLSFPALFQLSLSPSPIVFLPLHSPLPFPILPLSVSSLSTSFSSLFGLSPLKADKECYAYGNEGSRPRSRWRRPFLPASRSRGYSRPPETTPLALEEESRGGGGRRAFCEGWRRRCWVLCSGEGLVDG